MRLGMQLKMRMGMMVRPRPRLGLRLELGWGGRKVTQVAGVRGLELSLTVLARLTGKYTERFPYFAIKGNQHSIVF